MQLIKARQNLIVLDKLIIEENGVSRRDADADVIFSDRRGWCALRGQVHLNPFHVGLAQAHHHETGKEKEHDVDEWDDLDPGPLFWNR